MEEKIRAKLKEKIKLIAEIEEKGCGLQGKKYERTCKKMFCIDCHEIGVLYREKNLLKEILG